MSRSSLVIFLGLNAIAIPAFAVDHTTGQVIAAVHAAGPSSWSGALTMSGDVVVQTGATVTIAAGTTISVTGAFSMTFQGTASLVVNGVTFTGSTATPGWWTGLIFTGASSVAGAGLEIHHATHALDLGSTGAASLTSCVIANNRHAPGAGTAMGAGVIVRSGGPHAFTDCNFESNAVVGAGAEAARGGAIMLLGGSTAFLRDTFTSNSATSTTGQAAGGAIYGAAAAQIQDCTFTSNNNTTDGASIGGAVAVIGVNITFDGSIFFDNGISGGGNQQLKIGGAIGVSGVTPAIVTDCRFRQNHVLLTDGYAAGGAIGVASSATTGSIQRNLFLQNTISGPDWCEGGAVDFWLAGTGVVFNNLFVENGASNCGNYSPIGGALMANGDLVTGIDVHHNTFVGNTATDTDNAARGGGIYHQDGLARISNNILVNNTAAQTGGGVQVDAATNPTITNNYIFANLAPANPAIGGNGFTGTNDTVTNPLMVGPLTPFVSVDQYRLASTSPARNSATTLVPNQPTNDYDGEPRPQGPGPDVGFDEINAVDLELAIIDSADPVLGSATVDYTITARNNSGLKATNVSVIVTRDALTPLVSLTPSQGSCSGTNPYTCAIGVLNAGASMTIAVTLTMPPASNVVTLNATIATPVLDESDPSDNDVNETTTVDTQPPLTAITAPANGARTNDTTPTFTGTTEALAFVTVEVNGGTVCTTTADAFGVFSCDATLVLGEGTYSATAFGVDPAGNVGADSPSISFTVDLTAPLAPSVLTPAASPPTNDNTPQVGGTTEPFATVDIYIDSAFACTDVADAAGVFACDAPLLLDGLHSVSATATDIAGNLGPASAPYNFTVDTDPPAAQIDSGPLALSNDTTPAFQFSADEPSTFACRIAPAGFLPCSSPFTNAPLGDATYTFEVFAIDAAGNVSPTASVIFAIDATPPAPPAVTTATPTNDNTPLVTGSTEPFASVSVFVDGLLACTTSANGGGGFSCVSSVVGDGTHALTATATDAANNASAPSGGFSFTVDTDPPAAQIDSGPTSPSNDATPTFTFSADEASSFQCRVLPAGFLPCASPFTSGALASGTFTFEVIATDAAGNTSPPASATFTIDVDPPVAPAITAPALAPPTNDATPAVTGTTEPFAHVDIYIDSVLSCSDDADAAGAFACDASVLVDGVHAIYAVATDTLGNIGPGSTPFDFTVDTDPPAATIDSSPASPSSDSTPTFTFSADEASTFECHVVPAGFASCASPFTNGALADGPYTFEVRATDAAGNVSPTVSVSFVINANDPETTIDSGPPPVTNATTAVFTFSSDDAAATFECSLDGAAFAVCASGASYAGLSATTHAFFVRAVDPFGKMDASPANARWTIDLLPPNAPAIAEPAEGELVADTTPDISGTAEPFATITVTLDGTALPSVQANAAGVWSLTVAAALGPGAHLATAIATDAAGNNSPASPVRRFTIDPSALDTTAVCPPARRNVTSESIAASASDGAATFECSLDLAPFAACGTPAMLSGLAAGAHRFDVRAVLGAASDATPARCDWQIDLVAPNVPAITSPIDGDVIGTPTPVIEGTADPLASVEIDVDGMTVATVTADAFGAFSYASTTLSLGAHTVLARARDPSGNASADSALNSFTIDLLAIDTFIVAGPTGVMGTSGALFDLASNIAGATFECRFDGAGSFAPCSDPYAWTALSDGVHSFEARAVAAMTDPTPASRTFRVDTRTPAAPVILSPAANETLTSPVFSITGTAEPFATVILRIDGVIVGSVVAASDGSFSFPLSMPLANGAHTLDARALDAAGHESPATIVPFTVNDGDYEDGTGAGDEVSEGNGEVGSNDDLNGFGRYFVRGGITRGCNGSGDPSLLALLVVALFLARRRVS
ncbi:MAG: Ig-like domain repeat protein [Deltaproteobacteria bacterium]|nr:Ig-like domain repeat protein [Deltaproteobacteria bacterium]